VLVTVPDVSVVISAYNAADYLADTLESILNQRDVALELIAIDDGSTDATGALLDRYERDSRVTVMHQQNVGLTESLRRGCLMAKGQFIARHDAGDLSEPTRLAKQRAMLENDTRVAFVSCWTRVVAPRLEELWIEQGPAAAQVPVAIIDLSQEWGVIGGPTHHGSVMMRRDAYERAGGYRPAFRYGQDWDLWYRLAERGMFQIAQEVLYVARVTPDSISARHRAAQQEIAALSLAALRARIAGEDEQPFLDAARAVTTNAARAPRASGLYFIGEALRRRGDPRARLYLRAAIASAPWCAKAWLRLIQSVLQRDEVRSS
jgi:hypothetical protein